MGTHGTYADWKEPGSLKRTIDLNSNCMIIWNQHTIRGNQLPNVSKAEATWIKYPEPRGKFCEWWHCSVSWLWCWLHHCLNLSDSKNCTWERNAFSFVQIMLQFKKCALVWRMSYLLHQPLPSHSTQPLILSLTSSSAVTLLPPYAPAARLFSLLLERVTIVRECDCAHVCSSTWSRFLFPLLPQSLCSEVSVSCWWARGPQDLLAWLSPRLL